MIRGNGKIFMNYRNKESNKSIVNEKMFCFLIVISCIFALGLYVFNSICDLGIDNNLSGYIGLIAAPPTAYLWIIRERKKELELANKEEGQYLMKVSELNRAQSEAIEQFYDEKKMLAGAIALYSSLEEWINLSDKYKEHQKEIFIKLEQLASVLFYKYNSEETNSNQLTEIIKEVIVKLIYVQYETKIMFDWSRYKFKDLGFGTNINEYPGLGLKYANSFIGSELLEVTFLESEFTSLNLNNMTSSKSNFYKSIFVNANLEESKFIDSSFKEASFNSANLQNANLHDSDFFGAHFEGANLKGANLKGANFKRANLRGADLRGTDLTTTDFDNADLTGAKISGTYFIGADITGIDLEGSEFKNADFPYARIHGIEWEDSVRKEILDGHLQDLFSK